MLRRCCRCSFLPVTMLPALLCFTRRALLLSHAAVAALAQRSDASRCCYFADAGRRFFRFLMMLLFLRVTATLPLFFMRSPAIRDDAAAMDITLQRVAAPCFSRDARYAQP